MRFKVVENSILAKIARFYMKSGPIAITFGRQIHIVGVTRETFLNDKRWVIHELEHVKQFKKYGFFKFLFLYLVESIKKGYYLNKFEVEARQAELRVKK